MRVGIHRFRERLIFRRQVQEKNLYIPKRRELVVPGSLAPRNIEGQRLRLRERETTLLNQR